MNKSINWLGEKTIKFVSPISVDNGYRNNYQGNYESTMEFFGEKGKEKGEIEWIIDNGTWVEHIGLWFDKKNRLVDYDGVFDIPKQAVTMLRKLGFIIPRDFISK